MVDYFECSACQAVSLVSEPTSKPINVIPPKCSKCGGGWGIVRPNLREAVEKMTGITKPKHETVERRGKS